MPSPVVALDLVTKGLVLAGVWAAGDPLPAQDANDGLSYLNDVMEIWSTENLMVYGGSNLTFATVGGQAVYTIGPGGNWSTGTLGRPVAIDGGYTTVGGVDYVFDTWLQADYNAVQIKTLQEQFVQYLLYVNEFPLGFVTLWPTPSGVVPITVTVRSVLAQVATLQTVLSLPPGYAIALRYAIALCAMNDFGRPIPADIASIAMNTKARIKKSNRLPIKAKYDDALLVRSFSVGWQTG